MCRSNTEIEQDIQQKIAMFCHVDPENVVGVHDCKSIYQVPLLLEKQGILFVCLWIIFCFKKKRIISCAGFITGLKQKLKLGPILENRESTSILTKWRALALQYVFSFLFFFLPIHFHLATSGLWTRS